MCKILCLSIRCKAFNKGGAFFLKAQIIRKIINKYRKNLANLSQKSKNKSYKTT